MVSKIKELILLDDTEQLELDTFVSENNSIEEIFNMGLRFFRYGKFNISMGFFNEVLERDEGNAEALCNIGNILFTQGDYQNAKKIFKQINEKNPTNFRSNVMLGSIAYKEERIDDAISYWIVARSIDPVDCSVIANLAMAYEKKGFNFVAYYYYSKYISYSINGKIDEHEVILYKMKMITKTSDINYGVGLKYQKAKNLRNAAKAYLKVLDLYPNHLNANLNMGAICYKAGKYLEAAKYWQMAFLIDEHNLSNVGNIGLAYDSAKEYSYAYCFYKRFLDAQPKEETFEIMRVRTRIEEITPHAGVETASNHVRKADKFLADRNYMEALFEYENAKIINPESVDLEKKINALKLNVYPEKVLTQQYFELAEEYYSSKKYNEAIFYLKKLLVLDVPDPKVKDKSKEMMEICARIVKYKKDHKEKPF